MPEMRVIGAGNVPAHVLLFAPRFIVEAVSAINDRECRIVETEGQRVGRD
jgi:hypothetical protein